MIARFDSVCVGALRPTNCHYDLRMNADLSGHLKLRLRTVAELCILQGKSLALYLGSGELTSCATRTFGIIFPQ